jgi:protein-S-isoprenylcysteine O-methyltransferase Ste14
MSKPGSLFVRWRVRTGYPLALICLWLAWRAGPTGRSILYGSTVGLLGLLIRASAAGYLRKNDALASSGPYARTRNPLYFGSAFLAAAFAIASRSWIVALLLGVYFGVFYYAVMRKEEADLRARFGEKFDEYQRRVPLFWPRLGTMGASAGADFSWPQYLRNREYRAAVGFALLMAVFGAMAVWRK